MSRYNDYIEVENWESRAIERFESDLDTFARSDDRIESGYTILRPPRWCTHATPHVAGRGWLPFPQLHLRQRSLNAQLSRLNPGQIAVVDVLIAEDHFFIRRDGGYSISSAIGAQMRIIAENPATSSGSLSVEPGFPLIYEQEVDKAIYSQVYEIPLSYQPPANV